MAIDNTTDDNNNNLLHQGRTTPGFPLYLTGARDEKGFCSVRGGQTGGQGHSHPGKLKVLLCSHRAHLLPTVNASVASILLNQPEGLPYLPVKASPTEHAGNGSLWLAPIKWLLSYLP